MKNSFFCVMDLELTTEKEIIQISIVKLNKKLKIVDKKNYYFKPKGKVSTFVSELTGITMEFLQDKPYFEEKANELFDYLEGNTLVCHGLMSDYSILNKNFKNYNLSYTLNHSLDTVQLARIFYPTQENYKLSYLSHTLNLYSGEDYHNAEIDALVTARLLIKIKQKINSIASQNINEILKCLSDKYTDIHKFITLVLDNDNINNNFLIEYNEVKFRKISKIKKKILGDKFILFASIPSEDYAKLLNIKSDEWIYLSDKKNYVPLDIFELFDINSEHAKFLKMKLLIWILETRTGLLSELNLLPVERDILDKIESKIVRSKNHYYYNIQRINIASKRYIITDYSNIETVLTNNYFQNYILVFENSMILGYEINKYFREYIYYKDVQEELQKNIIRNKNVINIKENIDNLLKFFYEMQVLENINLYNDSIIFLKQDIESVIDDVTKSCPELEVTKKFLSSLYLTFTKATYDYKFQIFNSYSSMLVQIVNEKNVKNSINKIKKRKPIYIKNIFNIRLNKNININNTNTINNLSLDQSVLYLFPNNKYKEIYFLDKSKKNNVKYINFSLENSFKELYSSIKNRKQNYVCYATKDILSYSCYLNDIFDKIINVLE